MNKTRSGRTALSWKSVTLIQTWTGFLLGSLGSVKRSMDNKVFQLFKGLVTALTETKLWKLILFFHYVGSCRWSQFCPTSHSQITTQTFIINYKCSGDSLVLLLTSSYIVDEPISIPLLAATWLMACCLILYMSYFLWVWLATPKTLASFFPPFLQSGSPIKSHPAQL